MGVSPGTGRQAPRSPRPGSLAQARPEQGQEPQHSAAPTAPLCRGPAVLFQGELDVLLRVCRLGLPDALQGSHSGGTFGRTLTAVSGWSTRMAWPLQTAWAWAATLGRPVPVSGSGPSQASGGLFLLPALRCRLPGVAE